MSRPENLKTRIFLDGSDLSETDQMKNEVGFVDGQTTNPSNFVKALKKDIANEKGISVEEVEVKLSKEELYERYQKRVQEISHKLPNGSVSIEVYADANTGVEEILEQAEEMYTWIPNAHIKLPITKAGLEAAEKLVSKGVRVNMTLCFNQEQAAAVYSATKGAKKGDVFISPFIGRVYDKGNNGMNLVRNILKMYQDGDGHVEVLAASIRDGEQLSEAIALQSDITTSYLKAILEWNEMGKPVRSPEEFSHPGMSEIPYQEISLEKDWREYNIYDEMTDDGLLSFANDWNNLLK